MLFIDFKYHEFCLTNRIHINYEHFILQQKVNRELGPAVINYNKRKTLKKLIHKDKIMEFNKILSMIPGLDQNSKEKAYNSYVKYLDSC